MNAVSKLNPHLKDIHAPSALRNLQGWLIWRYEEDESQEKPRKVPYYTAGGRRHGVQGGAEDRSQLTTFEAAKSAAARRGFDGVGFALLPEWGLVALDFDNCIDAQGLHPTVQTLVAGTYAEYSPSGQGVRAFMRGHLANRKSQDPPFGFETFSDKGYVTLTGNTLDLTEMLGAHDTILDLSEEVRAYYLERFGAERAFSDPLDAQPMGLTDAQLHDALDVLDPDMEHDAWLHVGMALHHETQGQGFTYWNTWSKRGSKYPGEAVLHSRWNSFGRATGRVVTARTLVQMAARNGAHIGTVISLDEFENLDAQTREESPMPGAPHDPVAQAALPSSTPDLTRAANDLRYQPVPAAQFSQGTPPSWIVKGLVPKAELLVLFGESGSGKSFLALDLAFSIARGTPWRDHRVKQGRVVYLAAEGGGGFRKRLSAYALHHGIDLQGVPLDVIHATPNFLEKKDALDVAKAIAHTGKASVVVVDTFAQVMPGANENAGEHVGQALAHCRGIHIATGALVILVHHAGKDASKGARGWSGLRAAADAELEVIRTKEGDRYFRVSKQKDGEDGLAYGFKLDVVAVGTDEDGDVIDSCVAVESDVPRSQGTVKKRKLGANEQLAMDVIVQTVPTDGAGIALTYLVDTLVDRMDAPAEGGRDTRKQRAQRALKKVLDMDDAAFYQDGEHVKVLA
jgi:hypothetical protein